MLFFKFFELVLAVSILIEVNCEVCGQNEDKHIVRDVIGSSLAPEGAWPWMVSIRYKDSSGNFNHQCSGFLIDSKHVLTSAHCFMTIDLKKYRVGIGSVNLDEAEEYSIVGISIPEGYKSGFFYDDIAVLTLDREVDFPNFNPVCLPDEELIRKNLTGSGASIAGWGMKQPNGDVRTNLKDLSGLEIISNKVCKQLYQRRFRNLQKQFPRGIDSGILCAMDPPTIGDVCVDDSGSPLMYRYKNRWFAVGIQIFGISCGTLGYPVGYTSISNYLDWIRENARD